MTLLMVLLVVAVVAGVVAVVSGKVSGGLSEPEYQVPARALPAGPITGQAVRDLRFVQALRGYRMDQVDAAMDQLGAEIERLRALVPAERLARAEDPEPWRAELDPAEAEPPRSEEEQLAWPADWGPEAER